MGNLHLRFDEGRGRRSHAAVTLSPTLPALQGDHAQQVLMLYKVIMPYEVIMLYTVLMEPRP